MSPNQRWSLASIHACALVLMVAFGCDGQTHTTTDAAVDASETPALVRPTWMTPTTACDPLAAHELPLRLGNVIAAGKDERGTTYVVDQSPSGSAQRLFVSSGDVLDRKRILGSGQMGSSDYTWSFDDDGTEERLVAHKQGDEVTGIALAPAGDRTFFAQLDARAQQLTPVSSASLARFELRNLPGEVVIDYAADTADGARIVITRPMDDWTEDDYRLFYGTNGELFERVTSFVGATSYQAFDFIVDGASWHMVIASVFAPGLASDIEIGSSSIPLTPVAPSMLSNDTFECFALQPSTAHD